MLHFCVRAGRTPLFFLLALGRAPLFIPVHAGAWVSAPTCLQKFLPFSKTRELVVSNLRFRPISPMKASCGARKQELKRGLTRYRPTVPGILVRGEFHGSRQLCQRGVSRLPAALFKGKIFEKKEDFYWKVRKTLIFQAKKEFPFFKENSHSSRATRIRTLK